jgi:hypothetical protein
MGPWDISTGITFFTERDAYGPTQPRLCVTEVRELLMDPVGDIVWNGTDEPDPSCKRVWVWDLELPPTYGVGIAFDTVRFKF